MVEWTLTPAIWRIFINAFRNGARGRSAAVISKQGRGEGQAPVQPLAVERKLKKKCPTQVLGMVFRFGIRLGLIMGREVRVPGRPVV